INGKKIISVTKQAGVILHEVEPKGADSILIGDTVKCWIDTGRRKQVTKHHTAAHILNAAARHVLGPHIWQGGSYKDDQKAHLDLTHYRKITQEELDQIEQKANEIISSDLPIKTEVLPRTQAEKQYGFRLYQGGAVPGRELRIVSIGDIDHEACGGTHFMLKATGEIGVFKIVKREGVQDGIERITYKCGPAAIAYIQSRERLIKEAATGLGIDESQLPKATMKFFNDW
ncbi:MAG TPA: alanine--tRNA ligase, partial [Candidatus Micrarchaeota archaeon]|nr:alanine--tRNA ligase [Candidatus Micrarchaeota archaeon]